MNNIELVERIKQLKKCIESGTLQDFKEIAPSDGAQQIYFRNFVQNEAALDYLEVDLVAAYIRRYPDEFKNNAATISYFSFPLKRLLVMSIVDRDDIAYRIADVISGTDEERNLASIMLDISVCSEWYEFFMYCLDRISEPFCFINFISLAQLLDEKRYDCLDRLFAGASREQIICTLNNRFDEMNTVYKRPIVDYVCEIADRYIPEIRDSSDHAAAMTEFLDCAGLSMMIRCNPIWCMDLHDYYRTWDFMKEHGLKYLDLSQLFSSINCGKFNSDETQEILEEHLIPLIGDKAYVSALDMSVYSRSMFTAVLQLIEKIGKDKVHVDFTDRSFTERSDFLTGGYPPLKLKRAITAGLPVLAEDDLAGSNAAESLLNSSETLEYVLRSREYPDEQLDKLVELCIKGKKLDALNVIRKLKQERISSNLKKKD